MTDPELAAHSWTRDQLAQRVGEQRLEILALRTAYRRAINALRPFAKTFDDFERTQIRFMESDVCAVTPTKVFAEGEAWPINHIVTGDLRRAREIVSESDAKGEAK